MIIGIGIGIDKQQPTGVGYNADAQAHIARVEADGGVVDSPALCNNYFIYKAANSFMADVIIDAIPHVLGYKEGATSLKCSKIYGSAADGSGDIIQTNATYQPLLLRYAGEKYVYLPNLTGGNITTNGINGFSNYLQVETKVDITNLNNGLSTYSGIAAQRTNVDTGVFSLYYDNTGLLNQLYYYVDSVLGLQRIIDVSSVPIAGTEKYLRSTTQLNPTSISTVFESSMDGVSWTQVGTTITNSGIAPISFNNEPTTKLSIGSTNEGLASGISAKIYYCKIRQSAGVDTVVFDFAGYNPAISETSWTSLTGQTWSLNLPPNYYTASLVTFYIATVVTRTVIQQHMGNGMFTQTVDIANTTIDVLTVQSTKTILAAIDDYRIAWTKSVATPYNHTSVFYLLNDPPNSMLTAEFNGTFFTPLTGNLIFNNKNIINEKFTGTLNKFQYNLNTAFTATGLGNTNFKGIYTWGVSGSVPHNLHAKLVAINVSDGNITSLKNFINSSLFNGEMF